MSAENTVPEGATPDGSTDRIAERATAALDGVRAEHQRLRNENATLRRNLQVWRIVALIALIVALVALLGVIA